jgi:SAM-dependent methyltransferase
LAFVVPADAYDRFMGRYSTQLAPLLADFAGVEAGQRAVDVGCGPGALTAELVARLGPERVAAVDPSEPFVTAVRERHPGVDVRRAAAEELPFGYAEFDVALAQLVVHFMADPLAGLRELARVTRHGGVVGACVWDLAGGRAPVSVFWTAARELASEVNDESGLAGARQGHLAELFETAGLRDVEDADLVVEVRYASFDEWWQPYTLGVGPAGAYAASLEPDRLEELRERCRRLLPETHLRVEAHAWAARGNA